MGSEEWLNSYFVVVILLFSPYNLAGSAVEEGNISLNHIKNYLCFPYPVSNVIGPVTAILKSIVNQIQSICSHVVYFFLVVVVLN